MKNFRLIEREWLNETDCRIYDVNSIVNFMNDDSDHEWNWSIQQGNGNDFDILECVVNLDAKDFYKIVKIYVPNSDINCIEEGISTLWRVEVLNGSYKERHFGMLRFEKAEEVKCFIENVIY